MNSEQRRPWLWIVQAFNDGPGPRPALCDWCRFLDVSRLDYEGNLDPGCKHPLLVVRNDMFDQAWEFGDCWAFRVKSGVILAEESERWRKGFEVSA